MSVFEVCSILVLNVQIQQEISSAAHLNVSSLTVWQIKRPFLSEIALKAYWIPLNPLGWKTTLGQLMSAFWCFWTFLPFSLNAQLLSTRLGSNQRHQSVRAHGLGTLQREAQRPTPHELGQDAEGARHAKKDSVVVHLRHSIVLRTRGKQSQTPLNQD